jgi:hypothetical protein
MLWLSLHSTASSWPQHVTMPPAYRLDPHSEPLPLPRCLPPLATIMHAMATLTFPYRGWSRQSLEPPRLAHAPAHTPMSQGAALSSLEGLGMLVLCHSAEHAHHGWSLPWRGLFWAPSASRGRLVSVVCFASIRNTLHARRSRR